VLSALSPFVLVTWVAARIWCSPSTRLRRRGLRLIAHPRRVERGWRWLKLKLFMSLWLRDFFTMAVSRDLYEGVPAIHLNYLDEDYLRRPDPEGHEQDGVRVISAGPNAFLYVTDAKEPLDAAAVEERFPGLAERLSRSPGIGFVLARSADGNGALCWWQGQRCELSLTQLGPFAGCEDAALVVEGIETLMQMPSAGDLVIYGTDAPDGYVSFIREHGAHAGPGASEMHTFVVGPANVTLPSDMAGAFRTAA
jgi:hypothetical protein